ncbi:hypothetical protein BAE44_0002474 [Dichanthelium oligosanthes]|uniref:Uncharacterized protein n=1 Tax=Dichanthelium oligosanthes TaxID=888268 RepID=A0A1E5WH85_9POAL|nr:hypothetical protein BAE44_0002474 [Dichanthelium oligosanthes]
MAPPPGIVEVRCAGCGETLEVEPGLTEFACPDCGTHQALPPELMPRRPRRALPIPGRCAPLPTAPSRVACGGCGAVLSAPHGLGRFACPLCGSELAASQAAAVSVVAPPAAVPITPSRPAQSSQVRPRPSSQSTHVGHVQKHSHLEQTHGHRQGYSFREEPFTSSRADTGTEIPVVGRLQNEPANPSSHREESHTEPLDETISRPSNKKSRFVVGADSYPARKVHEEHPNQAVYASEAQGMPSKSSVHTAEDRFPSDTVTAHSKQKVGNVVVPSAIEQERTKSVNQAVDEQQAGEIPDNMVHADNVQVDFASEAGKGKRSAKGSQGNQKRKIKISTISPNELPHLRRSKRLAKGSHDIVDIDPIEKKDASPNQNLSEAPQVERTFADSDPSSPAQYRFPQGGSNDWEGVDATTPPALRHGTQQAEEFPQTQMYSPETMWALPVASANSWHDYLPLNFSGPTLLNQQPPSPLKSQVPAPIPNFSWNVQPPCPKVATTLSLLIKRNYPGIYLSDDTSGNGQSCEHVVYHWHQCPPDTRAAILDEFLKRYKWSPGYEEECQKIFDRKAVRQLVNLFCHEKQRIRQVLAAKKTKKSLWVRRVHGEMELEEDGGREDSYEQQGDESVVVLKHEDPLKWKPFVPVWMKPKWWEMLCDHWAKDEVMKLSYQQRKNRYSGKHPCNAAGSQKITLRGQLVGLDNGGKLGIDIDSPTKILGESVDQRCQTEMNCFDMSSVFQDTRDQPNKEAQRSQLGSHSVERQVGSGKRGRYCGAIGVSKKAQHESLSKSSPVCASKQGQQPMFTKEQVQEMINQALQGLNEAWEKKFLSLEQKMPSMSSSHIVPNGVKESSLAVGRSKRCKLARQVIMEFASCLTYVSRPEYLLERSYCETCL